jgi:2-oxoglutarate ferredoxin oxidoreductase subunit gamma
MQVEVMLTGVGGQGVQLTAKTLALAVVDEGRQAMMIGHYGGSMRGGQTDASIVVADGALRTLPILPSTWSAFVMHPGYWYDTKDKVRPGGVIVANSSMVEEGQLDRPDCQLFMVPANDTAAALGAPMSAAYVLLGAYCAITGMAGVEALVKAMKQIVPPYRTQHVATNETAIRTGAGAAPALAAPAWVEPAGATR